MESIETKGNPDIAAIRFALTEVLEELKGAIKTTSDQTTAINQLTAKVNGFEAKLENQKITTPPVDIQPVQETIKKGVTDIKLIVAAQPKNVVKKFQILLFPEQGAKLFYKVVFGRWFIWLAIMLLLTNLYKIGVHHMDIQKEIRVKEIENDKIKIAWTYLYEQRNRELHRKMDSALANTGRRLRQP